MYSYCFCTRADVALLVGMGLNADRTNKRILHWEASFAVTAVGLILLIGLANVNSPGGRYACTYILAAGSLCV
jgi:hypothetical protein